MSKPAWITKLALTKGIIEIAARDATRFPHDPNLLRTDKDGYVLLYRKPDWHDTREEAVARAEQMRTRQIAFHEKKLRHLKTVNLG